MSGIVRTLRLYDSPFGPRADMSGPTCVVCRVRRSQRDTPERALPKTMSGSRGSGATMPYSCVFTGVQSRNVICPSMDRLSTHAEPLSCWPAQRRYGKALSAVTWNIAAVGCVYQLLHDTPRLAEITAPWSAIAMRMSGWNGLIQMR